MPAVIIKPGNGATVYSQNVRPTVEAEGAELVAPLVAAATRAADIASTKASEAEEHRMFTEVKAVEVETTAAAVADVVHKTNVTATSEEPLVLFKTALGFVFAELYARGFRAGGVSLNAPGQSDAMLSIRNALGFVGFEVAADGALVLPGGTWRGTTNGGFDLSTLGRSILSYEGGALGLVGAPVKAIDDALFRVVNPLGFVALQIGLDGNVAINAAANEPVYTAPSVTPVIGTQLYLVSDRPTPLYVENILTTRTDVETAKVTIASSKGAPAQPFAASARDGAIMLDPARLGTSATLSVRKLGDRNPRLTKTLTVSVKAVPVSGSPAPKILLIGDSITNRQTGYNINALLTAWGFAPQWIGTIVGSNSNSSSATGGPLGEGREGWAFSDYLGTSLDNDVPLGVLAVGQEATYQAANKTDKRGYQPFLNPNTSAGAQTPIVTISGVNYRFDLRFYLDRFSLTDPDLVVVNIAMNDKTELGAAASLAQVKSGYGYLLDEIRRVLPAASIILWATNHPASSAGDTEWLEWQPILSAIVDIVTTRRAAGDANLHLCSTWAHQSGEAGWSLTSGTTGADGVTTTTISDITHPGAAAREQHAEALATAIACIA
ncbi:SGNH/GDSL hydrolase family protein [Sphingomonas hengshuiensis]|uniref:Uncharacterized protein n=1 Tax=Sphingomonas hengshuiensis TaxID=1609977 RepID=A0A7U4J9X3_9SPHN|nr:SGNH/GDSL hydrolase family protein [Sphingomonas hengshuiensis]AJP72919.1 hypothetical protein TS85_15665 [Sphingomonas hengshuiensis]